MITMHSAVLLLRTGPESIVGRFRRPVKYDQVVRRDDLLGCPSIGRSRNRAFAGAAWGRLLQTY
jgi:hypothetical protein